MAGQLHHFSTSHPIIALLVHSSAVFSPETQLCFFSLCLCLFLVKAKRKKNSHKGIRIIQSVLWPLPQAAAGHLQAVVSKFVTAASSKKPGSDRCLKIKEGILQYYVLINHCFYFLISSSFRYFHVLSNTVECKVARFVVDSAL